MFFHKKGEVEHCPECGSFFIQYNENTNQCYCLEKKCNYIWEEDLDFKNIKNSYLRLSIKNIPA